MSMPVSAFADYPELDVRTRLADDEDDEGVVDQVSCLQTSGPPKHRVFTPAERAKVSQSTAASSS